MKKTISYEEYQSVIMVNRELLKENTDLKLLVASLQEDLREAHAAETARSERKR